MEVALPLFVKALVEPGHMSLPEMLAALTVKPARVLGLPKGTLREGADADVTLIDPEATWTIDVNRFVSRSRNCPFDGWSVMTRVVATFVGGELKFQAEGNGRLRAG
jgi:dihydroorotase